jgi:peptide-methionine (R)-S-oxide reductase
MKRLFPFIAAIAATGAIAWQLAGAASTSPSRPMQETHSAPEPLADPQQLDDAAWLERLSPEQFRILRKAGTERPGGPVYQQFKQQGAGAYHCAGCGTRLFSSEHKFDARCGWPSFWDPAAIDSVETRADASLGMVRTEVVCAHCKGHLGHLFEGEGFDTPTDQRYCINGTALVFVEEPGGSD